ncbi:MAG: hypothetical protein OXF74_02660 [Rhodobacteraceae bacterium]|nr:hypothetical protein [Paracoccaceae bacterium]
MTQIQKKFLKRTAGISFTGIERHMLTCMRERGGGVQASFSSVVTAAVREAFDRQFPGVLSVMERRRNEAMEAIDPRSLVGMGAVEQRRLMEERACAAVTEVLDALHNTLKGAETLPGADD